jgi:hypothetical protein
MGFTLICGVIFAVQFAMFYGGIACIEHYTLRYVLWRAGKIPWNYVHFLNYAAERILLRKVGGGYMFMHRTLRDHFADMVPEQ